MSSNVLAASDKLHRAAKTKEISSSRGAPTHTVHMWEEAPMRATRMRLGKGGGAFDETPSI